VSTPHRARSAGALAALVVLAVAPGRADPPPRLEVHGLGAIDGVLTTTSPASDLTEGAVAARLRLDVRHAASGLVDFKLDFWGRFGALRSGADAGSDSAQELRELWVALRQLGGRVDVTLGRLPTPGGFWLIADGARIDVRYAGWLTQSFYGGLRAFTTQRQNADLDLAHPVALPLAGTALLVHHRLVDASLTFTWARDALDLPTSLGPDDERPQRDVVDELFLDGQVMVLAHPTLLLMAGASVGSRYDVQFQTADPTAPVRLGVATLGAVSGWAMAAWHPTPRFQLDYAGNYERLRLIESNLPTFTQSGAPARFTGGSFLDNSLRPSVTLWRSLRLEGQYRLRWRENTDLEHHAVLGLRGHDLWRGLGLFASVGLDAIVPGVTARTYRILYSGGLTFARGGFDASAGVLFTDGIGSGLLFSQAAPGSPGGTVPTQLFPYLLESNRVAFVRLFGTWRGAFAGLDVEENLDSVQLRAMAQLGYAR